MGTRAPQARPSQSLKIGPAVPRETVKLPKRQPAGDYVEPTYPFRYLPQTY